MIDKLNFLVIGAQKCATSWLYYCLKEHPELNLPKSKKEVEYIGGPLYQNKGGIKWYMDLFEPVKYPSILNGDVSVNYLMDTGSPAEIKKYAPDCKFIVSLRNPVERFRSAFYWYQRKGTLENKKNIKQDILRRADYLQDIFDRGAYASQLAEYFKYFDPDQFYIVAYDEIKMNPTNALSGIYEFLGVNAQFVPDSLNIKPKKNTYNHLLINIEKYFSNDVVSKIVDFLNQRIIGESMDKVFDKEIFESLSIYYQPFNDGLIAMLSPYLHFDSFLKWAKKWQ